MAEQTVSKLNEALERLLDESCSYGYARKTKEGISIRLDGEFFAVELAAIADMMREAERIESHEPD